MSRTRLWVLIACLLFLILPGTPHVLFGGGRSVGGLLHDKKLAENDLEVGGELAGIAPGALKYVSYSDLLKLPQVTYTVSDDTNFPPKTQISGIPLEQISRLLGAVPDARLVVAICYDGYRTNYPAAYIAAHRPLLVLKIDGKTEPSWPKSEYQGSLGPYLISHPSFKPSFKILSHTDEPQIPFGVTRIEFRNEQTVLGSIAPPGEYAADSPVMQGYRIAQQNCFRCHNMGAEGGQMAGRSWQILAMWAATEPKFFARFVKNPKDVDPKERMPGNPQYDAATIEVLRRYFASFAPAAKSGGGQ